MAEKDDLSQPLRQAEGGKPVDRRRAARVLAMQFLHELTVQGGANLDQVGALMGAYCQDEATRELALGWVRGAWQRLVQIEELIRETATHWDLSRISQVDRSILHLGVFQLLYCPEMPAKVVMNEAIELAKDYSTAQSPAFVNGILDAIHKQRADGVGPGGADGQA